MILHVFETSPERSGNINKVSGIFCDHMSNLCLFRYEHVIISSLNVCACQLFEMKYDDPFKSLLLVIEVTLQYHKTEFS